MKVMKMLRTIYLLLAVVLTTTTMFSCMDDDGFSLDKYTVGIVTVKPLGNNSYYLQWDDSTKLWPAAGITPNFSVDQEKRAFVNFTLLGTGENLPGDYDYAIRLNQADTILTKSIVKDMKDKNDTYYGNDPVGIKWIWIEDGYINFQFEAYFSETKKHFINLVKMDDAGTYELEFRHNAYGETSGVLGWGLVSFRLNSLPETNGETVPLKIKCRLFDGDKTYEIKYKSGQPTGNPPALGTENIQIVN